MKKKTNCYIQNFFTYGSFFKAQIFFSFTCKTNGLAQKHITAVPQSVILLQKQAMQCRLHTKCKSCLHTDNFCSAHFHNYLHNDFWKLLFVLPYWRHKRQKSVFYQFKDNQEFYTEFYTEKLTTIYDIKEL